jgi:acyl-coenzyme A thioesterase PaaI-like protein
MTDFYDEAVYSVPARIGAAPDLDHPTVGRVELVPDVCHGSAPRVAALMMLADTVVGMRLEADLPDDWAYTTDFSVRLLSTPTSGVVTAHTKVLRHGSRLMTDQLDYVDEADNPVARALITFMRSPLRPGEKKFDIQAIRERMAGAERPPLGAPLAQAAGVTIDDPSVGRVSLDPDGSVRRPGGFVQGSMVTLLGEVSATTLGEHHFGRPCRVVDFDVRYLLGGRTGPLVATAAWLGEQSEGKMAIEIVDQGHGSQVIVACLATIETAD